MGSALIAGNEKVEAKDRVSQKEAKGKGKREAGSGSKRAIGSGIREVGDNREVLRWKRPTVAITLSGSGKTSRSHAARTVSGNVAILSSHAPFGPRLFSRRLSRYS